MDTEKHIFVGPTASWIPSDMFDGWIVHPPVKRGDISKLLRTSTHSINSNDKLLELLLVDGLFYSVPAVGHQEILDALSSGCKVMGISSMGAIRAAELHTCGMLGYGKVFARLLEGSGLPDDYVTQLHTAEPEYLPLSDPLANLDDMLRSMLSNGAISAESYRIIFSKLSEEWYGNRNWDFLKAILKNFTSEDIINQYFTHKRSFEVKTWDFYNFLENRCLI